MRWLVRLIDDRVEQALILERARRTQSDIEKQIRQGQEYAKARYGGSVQTMTDPYRKDFKC